jgi:uncharacterized radical SAM protein YgiQ
MYDIIFVIGEIYFDHPLCGIAILKRLLEKNGYKVGIIENPKENDIQKLGKPKLFFAVSSGSIDSMVRNYTPLKKKRIDDQYVEYDEEIPDRAVIVYSNWIKKHYHDSKIVLGGTESSLRRFMHYDYWQNRLRRPVQLDSRADIMVYGSGEKQILEIAVRIKTNKDLDGIKGTCITRSELPKDFEVLPSCDEVLESKEKFCDMQNKLCIDKNIAQKIDTRYVLQYMSPIYTTEDLDGYYDQPFTRKIPSKHLRGFEFSVVTHRGCIGNCNFCSLKLMQGAQILSRSEESILKEIEMISKMSGFRGNIDDLGGPSVNMYGMDCDKCGKKQNDRDCINCKLLDKSHKKLLSLYRKARVIRGVLSVRIRSGIRYDLAPAEYISEVMKHHIYDTIRIAPEHVDDNVLKLMNKKKGNLPEFLKKVDKNKVSFYFMTAHPGSTIKEAKILADYIKKLPNSDHVQVFTPTPMSVSTCMYYTGMDPKTKKKIHVPYTYIEKKQQKRAVFGQQKFIDEEGDGHKNRRDYSMNQDNRSSRDYKPRSENRFNRESRPSRNRESSRDYKPRSENRYSRDNRPSRDQGSSRDYKPRSENRFSRESRPSRDRGSSRDYKPRSENRFSRESRPSQDRGSSRDYKPRSENRFSRESRPSRDRGSSRDYKPRSENRYSRESRPSQDRGSSRDYKPLSENRYSRESRPSRDRGSSRDYKPRSENRFSRESRSSRDRGSSRDYKPRSENRYSRDSRPSRDRGSSRDYKPRSENRFSRESRPSRDRGSSRDYKPRTENRYSRDSRSNRNNQPSGDNRFSRDNKSSNEDKITRYNQPGRKFKPNRSSRPGKYRRDNDGSQDNKFSNDKNFDKNKTDLNNQNKQFDGNSYKNKKKKSYNQHK